MAKEQAQRVMTPGEVARRKAAVEGDDPAKRAAAGLAVPMSGQTLGPPGHTQSYVSRVEQAAMSTGPRYIDYDRDGYPDAIVGRSGRNFNERLRRSSFKPGGPGQTVVAVPGRQDHTYGGNFSLGVDGYRQDQIGYRDRLRGRMAALAELAKARGKGKKGKAAEQDEDRMAELRLHALAAHPVRSHGGTGVGGGDPGGPAARLVAETPGVPGKVKYTPTQQAIMAPLTTVPGLPRVPGRTQPAYVLGIPTVTQEVIPTMEAEAAGRVGVQETRRQPSYGNPPPQGVIQPDGSFVVKNLVAAPGTTTMDKAEADKVKEAKTPEQVKAHEQAQAKAAEHKPGEHKAAEHKPAEHAKPHEHRPPEKK